MSIRHPLRSRAFVSAVAAAAVATAVLLGVLDVADAARVEMVVGLWVTAASVGGLVVATGEPVVTPTAAPRDDDGTPLVPATTPHPPAGE